LIGIGLNHQESCMSENDPITVGASIYERVQSLQELTPEFGYAKTEAQTWLSSVSIADTKWCNP